jgi:AraC-like DNA-binding protein
VGPIDASPSGRSDCRRHRQHQKETFVIRRFRRPAVWKAALKSTPVDLVFEPGDLCVSSYEMAFRRRIEGRFVFHPACYPALRAVAATLQGRLAHPFRVPAASPLASLLSAAIDAASAQVPLLSDELGENVLRNLCGLVALACGVSVDDAEQRRDSRRSAQLAAIQRHIDLNLSDPSLTPASAADALGLSVRQLHRLFEPTGGSFARYVLRQRLLKCRDAVAGATGTGRSVVDIAFGWGFNSMATFYRAFANEFGAAPVAFREARQGEGV